MDALILAAGRGTRLREGRAKCLVELGGRPLIHHQLDALRSAGVERFFVVAGYQAAQVSRALPDDVTVLLNTRYAQTNSLYSFLLARPAVGSELLVLNCDVLFHPLIAQLVAGTPASALAYDSTSELAEEEMKVQVRRGGLVTMGKTLAPHQCSGENVGLIHLAGAATRAAYAAAERIVAAGGDRHWLPAAVAAIAREHHVACLDVAGLPWTEIDFPEDLRRARESVLPRLGRVLAEAA